MNSYEAEQPWTPFLNDPFARPPRDHESPFASPPRPGCRSLSGAQVAVVGGGLAGLHAAGSCSGKELPSRFSRRAAAWAGACSAPRTLSRARLLRPVRS